MINNQIPAPPFDMVMPPVYPYVLAANFLVLAIVMVWIAKEASRTKSFVPYLIMIGATVASLTECLWDVLGVVWYPQYGHTPLYRLFNVSVPLWMLAAYPCYLGGQGYWMFKRLGEGISRLQLWQFYGFAWVTNIMLEVPVLQLGIYKYHGAQPFVLFGFPLWQAMGNSLMPIVIGVVVYTWREAFTGVRGLMLLLVIPVAQVIALGSVGWPMWLALHSGQGYALTYPASLITLAISLIIVYLLSLKICTTEVRVGQPAMAT